jgi:hypothetical protein
MWVPVNLKVPRDSYHSLRCPLFVLAVGASVGALMPMRMIRSPLVLDCVGGAFFSLFRATGEFMFAGSQRLRFRGQRPLRFGLRRPVNVGDVLARDGVGFERRGHPEAYFSGPATLPVFGLTRCTRAHAVQVTGSKSSSLVGSSATQPFTLKPVLGQR